MRWIVLTGLIVMALAGALMLPFGIAYLKTINLDRRADAGRSGPEQSALRQAAQPEPF